MSELASKNCVPCRGGVPPLAGKELEALAQQVPQWKVVDGHHITRAFKFPDFRAGAGVCEQGGRARRRRRDIIRTFCFRGARRK